MLRYSSRGEGRDSTHYRQVMWHHTDRDLVIEIVEDPVLDEDQEEQDYGYYVTTPTYKTQRHRKCR